MTKTIQLIKNLNLLVQDEDLTDEKLRDASEGLLPNLADYLNGCEHIADGVSLILKERLEQIEKHGFDSKHDGNESAFNLSNAAVFALIQDDKYFPQEWDEKYKIKFLNKNYKQRLIIAGALLAAELDKISNG